MRFCVLKALSSRLEQSARQGLVQMPNFRGCQPFLVIVQSPDGSTYQFVMPAYICIRVVGTWKSQIPLRTMAEEYLEEHVDWKALLDDPEHDVVIIAHRIRPFRRWREY